MNHWGRKLRSAVTDAAEIEMLLLKQVIVTALSEKLSVSYNDRFYLHPVEDGYAISKADDWAASVYFKEAQLGAACDKFIEQFVSEANFDPRLVLVRPAVDSPGILWGNLPKSLHLEALLSPESFKRTLDFLLAVKDYIDKNGDN